ncbi:hypothetical protein MTR67_018852 [Solanum verrucosum]|uniref:Integrase catalytic domain-containing protein n=1 Tax=Solanum verrucosum TaxID=315347 RepID=A0AAF0QKF0_SOLVR|nr:hypothetical protein MTR67_018852 [Solanum verrucosum]
MGVRLMSISDSGVTVQNGSESSLVAEVKEKKENDPILLQPKGAVHQQRVEVFFQGGDGVLCYQVRLCVPKVGLPRTRRQHDSIWVIVDRVTKSVRFLAVKTTDSAEDYAKLYINEIKGLGSQVILSTTFHPQTDGQAQRIIQTLDDMLRACVIDFKCSWHGHLLLIEFACNNNYHFSFQMAPYKALY